MTTNQNEHRSAELCRALAAELEEAQERIAELKQECATWEDRALSASNNGVYVERELDRVNALNSEFYRALSKISQWEAHAALFPVLCGGIGQREFYRNIAKSALSKAEEKP